MPVRSPSPHTAARISDIKKIIADSDHELSLAAIADRLGSIHNREFTRQYISLMIRGYGIEWKSPTVRLWRKKNICPDCKGRKGNRYERCVDCFRALQKRRREHFLLCPICGKAKCYYSNRCNECKEKGLEPPDWFDRKVLPAHPVKKGVAA